MNKDVQQAPDFTEDRHLDPLVKEFLKGINAGKPVESLSKEAARQVLSDAQSSVQVDLSGIVESEQTITENGLSVPLTVVRPQGSAGSPPCFVFIHGGGWILGDYPTHRRLVRDLVVASGFPAVFIRYTPSPEAKYPQALDEIYAAVRWIARNGARIGVDGSRMALAGNSVGGNMAIATALRAKREQGPQIKLLLPMWPVADSSFDTASYVRYAKQRFLTDSLMKWMFDQYTTDPQQRREVYVSPLRATDDELRGLPPTYIQIAENDILRDEGEALGRRLSEAGRRCDDGPIQRSDPRLGHAQWTGRPASNPRARTQLGRHDAVLFGNGLYRRGPLVRGDRLHLGADRLTRSALAKHAGQVVSSRKTHGSFRHEKRKAF